MRIYRLTDLLAELDYPFSVIGLTETKISNANSDKNIPDLKGYKFEYVPTPLASGVIGMYINDTLNYMVLEKTSNLKPLRHGLKSILNVRRILSVEFSKGNTILSRTLSIFL